MLIPFCDVCGEQITDDLKLKQGNLVEVRLFEDDDNATTIPIQMKIITPPDREDICLNCVKLSLDVFIENQGQEPAEGTDSEVEDSGQSEDKEQA